MIITSVFITIILLTVYFQPRWLVGLLAERSSKVVFWFPTKKRIAALTIDDVPSSRVTNKILDALRANDAHATFFVIGDHVAGNEAVLERIKREGHELGNHMAHEYASIRLDPIEFEKELRSVDQLISPPVGMKWFRPGSGWFNQRMLSQVEGNGYRCALGSIYPFDTWIRSEHLTSWYIESQMYPGAVIILHDGKPDRIRTANVLISVLPKLRARGYRILTLTELEAQR